ncbi:MAG: hypothetical protein ACRCYE_13165, partial [Sarcina sp.]
MGIKSKASIKSFDKFKGNKKSFLVIVITIILSIIIAMLQPIYNYYSNIKFIKVDSLFREEVTEYLGSEIKEFIIPMIYKELYKSEDDYKKAIELEYNKHINYSKKEVYRKVVNLLIQEVDRVFEVNESSEKINETLLTEYNEINEKENFDYEIIKKIFNEELDNLDKNKLLQVDKKVKEEYQNFIKKRDGEIAYTNQLYNKKFKDFKKLLSDTKKSNFDFRLIYKNGNNLEEIDSNSNFGLKEGYYWKIYTDTDAIFVSKGASESDEYYGGIGDRYTVSISNEIKDVGNIHQLIIYLPKDITQTGVFNEAFRAELKNNQNNWSTYIVIAAIALILVLIGMLNFKKKIFSNFRNIPIDIILIVWIIFSVINFYVYRPYYIPMILYGGFNIEIWSVITELMGSLYMIFTFLFCSSEIAYINEMGIKSRFSKEKLFILNIKSNSSKFIKSISFKEGRKLDFIKKRLFDIKAFSLTEVK